MPKPRILVIDDDAGIRESLRMTLEYEGYDFIGAATGQEGLALADSMGMSWLAEQAREFAR